MNTYVLKDEDKQRLNQIETPVYVVDRRLLKKNLECLKSVQDATGCKILLALKGFSMHAFFPMIGEYLAGITSSSLFEARLGYEKMGKEVHIYTPAYREEEFDELMNYCGHMVFNSPAQYKKFKHRIQESEKPIECGLRINPEYSELKTAIYDPCSPNSRLGTTLSQIKAEDLEGLSGLHFHTMCEQNSDTLLRTIRVVEEKFGPYLHQMKWINFGGGHHITRQDYDLTTLIQVIRHVQETYQVEVYLEPGEAIALNTGYLVASVLDLTKNGMELAIVDTSAACHMPDVLEMPYRPGVIDSREPGLLPHTYRIGGMTCLAGDVIGDYSFEKPLQIGDRLIFTDMAHYTMVKNNMFNGVNLPSIAIMDEKGIEVIRKFRYEDYRDRLS